MAVTMFGAIASLLFAALATPEADADQTTRRSFLAEHYERIADECRRAEDGVHLRVDHVCLSGLITSQSAAAAMSGLDQLTSPVLAVNSPGGSVTPALELATHIAIAEVSLIVAERCYSSCANYLVPVSQHLYVAPGALIVLHGSPPRDRTDFMAQQIQADPVLLAEIQSDGFNPNDSEVIRTLFEGFERSVDQYLEPETRFFAQHGRSTEQYLHRYWEAKRNVERYATDDCQPEGGFLLITGPEYLKEFSVLNPDAVWWPDDETVARRAADLIGEARTYILDMNLLPSWLPDRGYVRQSQCLADLNALADSRIGTTPASEGASPR